MITNKFVARSIEYILEHLNEEILIEDVANYCHFSKYHFNRVFKAETGESIYAFVKRLRMEQSALKLKIEKDKTVTEIGLEYGYSPSNYSSAFKKHHRLSPIKFRRGIKSAIVNNPLYPDKQTLLQSFEAYNRQISIQLFTDFTVIYERHIGNYNELGKNWCDFTAKYQAYITKDTLFIERSYNDPSITSVEQCLYDICMTVGKDCPLNKVMTIPGGKFAVYRYDGPIEGIFNVYQGLFTVWLADSSWEIDDRYGLDIYQSVDHDDMQVVMDICLPVK